MKIYEKTIPLINRVYTWGNVLNILEIIENQAIECKGKLSICITCDDGLRISYNTVKEIDDQHFFSNYKTTKISASLNSEILNIYFYLTSECGYSEMTVETSEKILFHSLLNQVDEVIRNVEKQKLSFFHKNPLLTIGGIFVFTILFSLLIYWLLLGPVSYLGILTISSLSSPIALLIIYSGQKAYPEVEFKFVPDNKNNVKKYRGWMYWIWASIVLPIIISKVCDVFKG